MVIDIGLSGMLLSYLLFSLVLFLVHKNKLGLTKDLVVSTFRMTFQLLAVGWLLHYIFEFDSWFLATVIFLVMVFFGSQTILARAGVSFPRIRIFLFSSLLLSAGTVLAFYLIFILAIEPLFASRYFIPLAGMIIGNSMSGCTIAVERFFSEVKKRRLELEVKAALGANVQEASSDLFRNSLKSSLLPTLTSMTGMGIVFLPGMMTGQILGGAEPMVAIKYQITVMLAILASVALSSLCILSLERRALFNTLGLPDSRLFYYTKKQ